MSRGPFRTGAGSRWIAATLAATVAITTPAVLAQTQQQPARGGAQPARRAPAPPAAASPNAMGLNALTDDALFSELAGRGQDSLLDRAFEINKGPEARRAGLRAFGALRELTNKQKPPTPARRQALIAQVVAGARTVLPTMKDPAQLSELANLLLTEGALRDVNLLEYWGENPATQNRLRPVMETVAAMYDRAAGEAEAARAEVEKRLVNPDDKALADRWAKLDDAVNIAQFDRRMADDYLALSLPKAERAKVADTAIEYLKELDTDDSDLRPAM